MTATQNTNGASVELLGRLGLAALFLMAGLGKISGYDGTAAYMESAGVPGLLLPAVIAAEVLGALFLAAGFMTRWTAWALALFSVVSAVLFHFDFANQMQSTMFLKNVAIAGGLLILAHHGAGRLSIDHKRTGA